MAEELICELHGGTSCNEQVATKEEAVTPPSAVLQGIARQVVEKSRATATRSSRASKTTKTSKRTRAIAAATRAARRAAKCAERSARRSVTTRRYSEEQVTIQPAQAPAVYGDAAYGTGAFLDVLETAGIASFCKVQPPTSIAGRFSKDNFSIDLDAEEVTCPAGVSTTIRHNKSGDGIAVFGEACLSCSLRASCTEAKIGRNVRIGRYEAHLAKARAEQQSPEWRGQCRPLAQR